MDEEEDTGKVVGKPSGNGTSRKSSKIKRRGKNLPTLVPNIELTEFGSEVGGCDNGGG